MPSFSRQIAQKLHILARKPLLYKKLSLFSTLVGFALLYQKFQLPSAKWHEQRLQWFQDYVDFYLLEHRNQILEVFLERLVQEGVLSEDDVSRNRVFGEWDFEAKRLILLGRELHFPKSIVYPFPFLYSPEKAFEDHEMVHLGALKIRRAGAPPDEPPLLETNLRVYAEDIKKREHHVLMLREMVLEPNVPRQCRKYFFFTHRDLQSRESKRFTRETRQDLLKFEFPFRYDHPVDFSRKEAKDIASARQQEESLKRMVRKDTM